MVEKLEQNSVNSIFQVHSLFANMVSKMSKSSTKKLTIVLLTDETIFGNFIGIDVKHLTDTYTVTIKTDTGEKTVNFKDVKSILWEDVANPTN